MTSYKLTWRPHSAYSTQLQSDTIFGHLCWAVSYLFDDNNAKLLSLLSELERQPVLRLSSAFVQGKLPKPACSLKHEALSRLSDQLRQEFDWLDDFTVYSLQKKARQEPYVTVQSLVEKAFVYDLEDQHYAWLLEHARQELARREHHTDVKDKPRIERSLEFHNRIDRLSGTTGNFGELFASPVVYSELCFESYLETDFFSEDELRQIFRHISQTGFGKDKSTGKGRFEIELEPHNWGDCPQFNAYLNLSNMVPAANDPLLVAYDSGTKFAKLGGDYATTATPFKYPLYMFHPGAVFFVRDQSERPTGSMLKNVHPDPRIVQNLYSYNIPIYVKGS